MEPIVAQLVTHSVPSTTTSVLSYLEAYLLSTLSSLLARLRILLRTIYSLPLPSPSTLIQYDRLLLLLLLRHGDGGALHYRFAQYLAWEGYRKKAKESVHGISGLDLPVFNAGAGAGVADPEDDLLSGDGPAGAAATAAANGAAGEPGTSASAGSVSMAAGPSSSGMSGVSEAQLGRPEDAWDAPFDTLLAPDADFLLEHAYDPIDRDSLAAFETYAPPLAADALHKEIQRRRIAVNAHGVIQHFQKLKAVDIATRGMDASEYIHFTEARAQASLSHNKIRSKRFRELIAPLLAANDIPVTDELVDSLGFLANDIVVDLLERAKGEARRRIMALRQAEQIVKEREEAAKEAQRRAQAVAAEERARRKARLAKRRGMAPPPADVNPAGADAKAEIIDNVSQAGASVPEETTVQEAERVARREIDRGNARPTGPFSAPAAAVQQAYPHATSGQPAANKISAALACPATVESPLDVPYDSDNAAGGRADDGPALLPGASRGQEATKVESQTAMSDIVSGFDILLGDFEGAGHARGIRVGVSGPGGCTSLKRKRGFTGMCG